MKKLRLILTEKCNRSCLGCCNNDFDISSLPQVQDITGYDKILITGGEPMLYPDKIEAIVGLIRTTAPNTKIIMYTAKTKRASDLAEMLEILDGITVTLHEQYDVEPFKLFTWMINNPQFKNKSLRLNVFNNVKIDNADFTNWQIKDNIKWIKDCPLPKDEILMRL